MKNASWRDGSEGQIRSVSSHFGWLGGIDHSWCGPCKHTPSKYSPFKRTKYDKKQRNIITKEIKKKENNQVRERVEERDTKDR